MQVKKQLLMDWFKIGKGVCHGYILSPYLFNFCAKYIMWNARLDESQAGIKVGGRNINNLRYADDTTLIAESKEELKSLLMRVKKKRHYFANKGPSSQGYSFSSGHVRM